MTLREGTSIHVSAQEPLPAAWVLWSAYAGQTGVVGHPTPDVTGLNTAPLRIAAVTFAGLTIGKPLAKEEARVSPTVSAN